MKPNHHPFLRRWVDRLGADTVQAVAARFIVFVALAICAAAVHRLVRGGL